MTIEKINVTKAIENTNAILASEKNISPALKSMIELLTLIIKLLCNRLNLNSNNSNKPPSQDPNRPKNKKIKRKGKKKRRPGGQNGHNGSTLEKFEKPHEIVEINIDRRTLPIGNYHQVDFESRQIVEMNISLHVTEYRAEILEDEKGNQFVAEFPEGLSKAVQYGAGIKAQSVYMSQFQLIPYERVKDYFEDQAGIPISTGTLVNFNKEAFDRLEDFEKFAKEKLLISDLNHADETGINVNGKRIWLHSLSNDKWTYFYPHDKRGMDAMDEMGILPKYFGILIHDHWKPYFGYPCTHALCNAHQLRELDRAWEQDGQRWAMLMKKLLEEINEAVKNAGGVLAPEIIKYYQKRYRDILTRGEKECPATEKIPGKRGRQKKTKSRNLLDRLKTFEEETLRFMKEEIVPFTNNQGENDLRMTKVQQKISGCFRSMEGAKTFCRIRSYLITARKHGMAPAEALNILFTGKLPFFVT